MRIGINITEASLEELIIFEAIYRPKLEEALGGVFDVVESWSVDGKEK